MFFIKPGQVDAGFGHQGSQFRNGVQGCTNAAGAWMRKSGEVQRFEDDVHGCTNAASAGCAGAVTCVVPSR